MLRSGATGVLLGHRAMAPSTLGTFLRAFTSETGICELAETTYGGRRLIVRRVHLHAQDEQSELFAYWRPFAFLTNRTEDMHTVDAEHRDHAEVELQIRDLKDQALAHFPYGSFAANSAWTVIACLAHNLVRWVGQLGLEDETWRAARTIRRWLIALPGRLPAPPGASRCTCRLAGPGETPSPRALSRIRALAAVA